jgi:hypothetical protein
MNLNQLEKLDTIPLSNEVFTNSLGIADDDILKYRELSKFNTIDDLLPNNGDFKIIFLDWGSAIGHWVCLLKINNKFEYFNSFGCRYDLDLNVLTRCMKRILGEDTAQITRLLGKNKCSFSKYRYQGKKSNSCGRYIISRIQCLQIGINNEEYHEYMINLRDKYEIPFDLISCLLVPLPRLKE